MSAAATQHSVNPTQGNAAIRHGTTYSDNSGGIYFFTARNMCGFSDCNVKVQSEQVNLELNFGNEAWH